MARYINAEHEKIRFVADIADVTTPTITEINGGTKLDGITKAVTGFEETADNKETPDLGHRVVTSIPGQIKLGTASLDIYRGATGDLEETAGAALAKDATGFIVFYDKAGVDTAAIAGTKVDIWPVTVRANNIARGGAVDDPASRMIEFSITGQPTLQVSATAGS